LPSETGIEKKNGSVEEQKLEPFLLELVIAGAGPRSNPALVSEYRKL
jgi:hypothetical protein